MEVYGTSHCQCVHAMRPNMKREVLNLEDSCRSAPPAIARTSDSAGDARSPCHSATRRSGSRRDSEGRPSGIRRGRTPRPPSAYRILSPRHTHTQQNCTRWSDALPFQPSYCNMYWLLYILDLSFVLFLCTTAVWQFAINEYVMLCYIPFLLLDWLRGFPGLFTDTSEHICFLLISFFCFPLFSFGSVRQIKLTYVSFWAHTLKQHLASYSFVTWNFHISILIRQKQ